MATRLHTVVLALLAQPARVLLLSPARSSFVVRPAVRQLAVPALRARPLVSQATEDTDPYRTLGITEDAGYDEINDAFDDLAGQYANDASRLATLEAAKDAVVNNMLQRRMAGAAASYEGMLALEDRKAPPKTPIWVIANDFRKRVILMPTLAYAGKVLGLMGGLAVAAWIAPSTAQTASLVNTLSGMGFMYNRGEAEVPRDDFGQIGEIRPMKPRPMALTCTITALVWLFATLRTKHMLALLPGRPPKGLDTILRTSFVTVGLLVPALFLKVQGFFPND